ncbi:MAG: hypothetical protein CMF48_06155 [Legionellales bacterium]|nr:hypothetical protein [Legionellales bacterium]
MPAKKHAIKNIIPKKYRPLSKLGHLLPFLSGLFLWLFPETAFQLVHTSEWAFLVLGTGLFIPFERPKFQFLTFNYWVVMLLISIGLFALYQVVSSFVLNSIVLHSPIFYQPDITEEYLFDKSLSAIPIYVILVFAYACFCLTAKRHGGLPLLSGIATITMPTPLNRWFGHYRNVLVQVINVMVITLSLIAVICYAFTEAATHLNWALPNSVPFIAGAGFALILPFFTYDVLNRRFFRAFSKLPAPFFALYIALTISLFLLSMILSRTISEVIVAYGNLPSPSSDMVIALYLESMSLETRLDLFLYSWTLLTVPFVGSALVKLYQPLSPRVLVISAGIIFSICVRVLPGLSNVALSVQAINPEVIAVFIILILGLFLRTANKTDVFALGFSKSNQTTIKCHGFSKKASYLGLIFVVMLQTHTMSGWFGLQSMTTMAALLLVITFLSTSAFYTYLFFKIIYLSRVGRSSSQVMC